jgi:hypothetical protein
MAQGFADMRRYMELLIEDVRSWTRVLVDGAATRTDVLDARLTAAAGAHERRLDRVETRVAKLETTLRRREK